MVQMHTVGFSNQPLERFIQLCKRHNIDAIADVRSTPSSRYTPQFDRGPLQASLKAEGITYVFLGKELGARPTNLKWYRADGRLDWETFAESELFRSGLVRAINGAKKFNLALGCTEKDPLDCHRSILIAQQLCKQGVSVDHILANGKLEKHTDALLRLRKSHKLDQPTLLDTDDDLTKQALRLQEYQIAYQLPKEP